MPNPRLLINLIKQVKKIPYRQMLEARKPSMPSISPFLSKRVTYRGVQQNELLKPAFHVYQDKVTGSSFMIPLKGDFNTEIVKRLQKLDQMFRGIRTYPKTTLPVRDLSYTFKGKRQIPKQAEKIPILKETIKTSTIAKEEGKILKQMFLEERGKKAEVIPYKKWVYNKAVKELKQTLKESASSGVGHYLRLQEAELALARPGLSISFLSKDRDKGTMLYKVLTGKNTGKVFETTGTRLLRKDVPVRQLTYGDLDVSAIIRDYDAAFKTPRLKLIK